MAKFDQNQFWRFKLGIGGSGLNLQNARTAHEVRHFNPKCTFLVSLKLDARSVILKIAKIQNVRFSAERTALDGLEPFFGKSVLKGSIPRRTTPNSLQVGSWISGWVDFRPDTGVPRSPQNKNPDLIPEAPKIQKWPALRLPKIRTAVFRPFLGLLILPHDTPKTPLENNSPRGNTPNQAFTSANCSPNGLK